MTNRLSDNGRLVVHEDETKCRFGTNVVHLVESCNEYGGTDPFTVISRVSVGGMSAVSLAEMLQAHIYRCQECQISLNTPPPRLGEKGKLCPEWFGIIQEYAEWEGQVNNIVGPETEKA